MIEQTVTIQVAPQIAQILLALQRRAEAEGVSLDSLLSPLVPGNGAQTPTPFELAEDFIGSVDSSVPDPTSPTRHTAFGAHLFEEHKKQAQRSSALSSIAAQQGVTAGEWVRQNFPDGRDSQGRRLSEALDALILEQDSKL